MNLRLKITSEKWIWALIAFQQHKIISSEFYELRSTKKCYNDVAGHKIKCMGFFEVSNGSGRKISSELKEVKTILTEWERGGKKLCTLFQNFYVT